MRHRHHADRSATGEATGVIGLNEEIIRAEVRVRVRAIVRVRAVWHVPVRLCS